MDSRPIYHIGPKNIHKIYDIGPIQENSSLSEETDSVDEKTMRKGHEILSDKKRLLYRKTVVLGQDGNTSTYTRYGLYLPIPKFEFTNFSITWRYRSK